jgi:hypothetical protein
MNTIETKHEVRVGIDRLPERLTMTQARRWGEQNMPGDLRRAGFKVCIHQATYEINGWDGYRVSYGKPVKVPA